MLDQTSLVEGGWQRNNILLIVTLDRLTGKVASAMQRVQVRVPATIASLGTGLHSLGLALSIHTHVTLQVRDDSELSVEVSGATDTIPATLDNLALRAAIRVFQQLEDAPTGLHVEVYNAIPLNHSLGEKTALVVGGLVAAHNLIETPLSRDDLVQLALQFDLPYESIVTAMLGGVGLCSMTPHEPFELAYTSLDTPPLRVIVVRPDVPGDELKAVRFPNAVRLVDAIREMRQALVLAEGLRSGDYALLRRTLRAITPSPKLKAAMPHLTAVQEAALAAGAAGLTFGADGDLLLAFAQEEPHEVADAMVSAFNEHGIKAQRWVLPIDRQGVVISVLGDPDEEDEEGAEADKPAPQTSQTEDANE